MRHDPAPLARTSTPWLALGYALAAVAGTATALYYGVPYWTSPDASFADFGAKAYASGPAATLSADVTVSYFLANVFVVVEGRRSSMRHVWLYVLANTLVAVAAGLALFLCVRELGRRGPSRDAA
jgi:hypothetical protein